MASKCFHIIGAGKMGKIAFARLSAMYPDSEIIVVDINEDALKNNDCRIIQDDGIAYVLSLCKTFKNGDPEVRDFIIPAIPVHVAYEWLKKALSEKGGVKDITMPEAVLNELPIPFCGSKSQVYASYADFLCPDNCREKGCTCGHSGKERPEALWKKIAAIVHGGFNTKVLRSAQLGPGVGGYTVNDLIKQKNAMVPGKTIFATACKCHGVVNAFEWRC